MKLIVVGLLVVLTSGCAHTPKQPADRWMKDELVARGIWWAIRVVGPGAEYHVHAPPGVLSKRVLGLAASYALLVVGDAGVLRRPDGSGPAFGNVRLTLSAPQWVTSNEVVIRFGFTTGVTPATQCAVKIRPGDQPADTWSYQPLGEERCWPRPSGSTAQ